VARRAGGAVGLCVPGIRDALIDYWRCLDKRWTGQRFGEYADVAEHRESINVGYEALFCAAFSAGIERRVCDLDHAGRYMLTGDDVLTFAGSAEHPW
jgi:hypothetical protein